MLTKICLAHTGRSAALPYRLNAGWVWILLAAGALCSVPDILLVNWPTVAPDLLCDVFRVAKQRVILPRRNTPMLWSYYQCDSGLGLRVWTQ